MKNLIDNLNEKISYEEGKLKFELGRGVTSELMKRLYNLGYRATKSGIMHYLNDTEGNKICTAYSWEGLLFETSKIMA